MSLKRMGEWPWVRGESWLGVVMTLSLPPTKMIHPQPEPNCLAVVSLKVFLKASKSPKSAEIWSAMAPEGAPPTPAEPAGPMRFQKAVWLEWPPPLLRTAPLISSGTLARPRIRSSADLAARWGWLAKAALRLLT